MGIRAVGACLLSTYEWNKYFSEDEDYDEDEDSEEEEEERSIKKKWF